MNRRTFLERSAMAAGGLTFASLYSACGTATTSSVVTKPIGIQLYTLKRLFEKDVKGTLKIVADTGFTEVETYGYDNGNIFGVPYAEFAAEVKRLGLKLVSGHYGTGQTTPDKKGTPFNEWERAANDAKEAGQHYTTIAWLDQSEWNTLDALRRTCEILNKAGEINKQYGLQMAYHNHAFEFGNVGDEIMYDVMLRELDPALVTMEMDLYWVVYAGIDPLTYFNNHPGRFALWHVKDMDKADRTKNSDVGSGSIDFKSIFAAAGQSGMKHFFLEQESFVTPETESIKKGYDYLNGIV